MKRKRKVTRFRDLKPGETFRFYRDRHVCEKATQRSAIAWSGEWGEYFVTRAHLPVVRCKREDEDFWDFLPADENGRRYLGDGVYV